MYVRNRSYYRKISGPIISILSRSATYGLIDSVFDTIANYDIYYKCDVALVIATHRRLPYRAYTPPSRRNRLIIFNHKCPINTLDANVCSINGLGRRIIGTIRNAGIIEIDKVDTSRFLGSSV